MINNRLVGLYGWSLITAIILAPNVYGMGLRSFVALPIEQGGTVVRFAYEAAKNADTDTLITSVGYGITAKQALLLGMPYRLSPSGNDQQGDMSILYRQVVLQKDSLSGTDRLGLLAGAIVPMAGERDAALQAGFVYTRYLNRHEFDIDLLYQLGLDNREDTGRYDVSWQYRLLPSVRPDWGIGSELNTVLELNGRWKNANAMTHQLTMGLQWVNQYMVLEGGVAKDLNNENELRYLLSTRFHF